MADFEASSVKSEEREIDEDWDVINAENELEQLTNHFERGGVGASLVLHGADGSMGSHDDHRDSTVEAMATLQARNAAMEARIAELEHELSYADKARATAEHRNVQLCASNASLAEDAHKLTDALSRLKREKEVVEIANKTLEKSSSELENFVEETISNSQSGYNYLCEARERVSDITKDLMGLRTFIKGGSAGLIQDESGMGFKGGVLQAVMSDLNVTLAMYTEVFSEVSLEVRRLKKTADRADVEIDNSQHNCPVFPVPDHYKSGNKIALSDFTEGDVAMFFPTPKGDYVAFNIGSPHHYLSEESKALIGHDPHFKKVYVLGRIIIKEEQVAPDVNPPYNLKPGTAYYEISVESIVDLFPPKPSRRKSRDGKASSNAERR